MIKLSTKVDVAALPVQICPEDRVMVLGSCFADNIGAKLADGGFNVCVNPFGTLYNPVSIANAVARLGAAAKGFDADGESGSCPAAFGPEDCVEMGAGAGLICSWWHHTRFARPTADEFLEVANASLAEAAAFWKDCNKVIISLGTAMVWKLLSSGEVVANCLKRPDAEFSHEMLSVAQAGAVLQRILKANPGKEFIFTVSPIRHLGNGAHENTLSKATLQLALQRICAPAAPLGGQDAWEAGPETWPAKGGRISYFPAYEILLDELRDYRFYADDLVHPAPAAIEIIWERFLEAAVPAAWHERIRQNEKAARRSAHRPIR